MAAMEVLGFDASTHEIVWRWHRDDGSVSDEITATEDELTTLLAEFATDRLPLWPQESCRYCDGDAVQHVEGDPLCRGHVDAYIEREAS